MFGFSYGVDKIQGRVGKYGCLVLSALYAMSMIEQKDVSCTNAVQSFQEKSECWRSYICWIYGYGYIYIYLLIYGYMTDIC
jgi:hypothetical protein